MRGDKKRRRKRRIREGSAVECMTSRDMTVLHWAPICSLEVRKMLEIPSHAQNSFILQFRLITMRKNL